MSLSRIHNGHARHTAQIAGQTILLSSTPGEFQNEPRAGSSGNNDKRILPRGMQDRRWLLQTTGREYRSIFRGYLGIRKIPRGIGAKAKEAY